MSAPSPDDWQRREELLDDLLALAAHDRDARLAEIGRRSPDDAAALRAWMSGIERSSAYLDAHGASAPVAGMVAGAWRLERRIGRGGMGEVWLGARADGLFEKQVAIKFIRDDRAALRRSLEAERRVLAGLRHAGIARLLDAGTGADGHPYLVTEYIDGATLDAWFARERPSLAARVELFRHIAAAVAYAHERLVVHRDIKPANVLVDAAGAPHLLDFGIARALAGDGVDVAATLVALTPEYAAPELAADNAASVRSDVYALGGVLHFLLAGRAPLELGGLALAPLVEAIRTREPARIDVAADPALAAAPRHRVADFEAIARKALAKDPAQRYGSVEALLRDVDAALDDRPIAARDGDARERVRRYVRRHRIALGVAAALLLTLAAGLAGTLWQAREARLQQGRAEREADHARAEAQSAIAVRDFLVGVFAAANPEETGGRTPTALDLADAGLRRVDGELSGQPRLQAALLAALGAAYGGLGQSDRAIDTLRRARERAVQADGEDSPAAMRATVDLAAAIGAHPNADTPRRREEIAPLLEALAARETAGADVGLRVGVLTQYGVLLQARGDAAAAEGQLVRAVDLGRAAGDVAAARTADALLALHALLAQQGRVGDAIARLREALAIRALADGAQGAATLAIKTDLGFMLGEAGSLDEAADLLAQVLDARRAIYGERHPRYAHALIALASIRDRQGRAADAETMLDEALAIARSALGTDSDLALSALNSLAGVRAAQHDPEDGIRRSREAVAMSARMYGDAHELTLRLRDNLAGVEALNGDYDAAEADARAIIAAHAGKGSRNTGYARFWLGHVLRLRGDAAAAKAAHEQALAELLELQGEDSNFALNVRAELAEDERDLGDYAAARVQVERAFADAARIAPGVDDPTARSLRYLGAQLDLLQARADEATAAELDRVFARAKERRPTPMARWQAAGAGLFSALCRLRLGIGDAAEARAQIRASGDVLRTSPLADPFLRKLAAPAAAEARRTLGPPKS